MNTEKMTDEKQIIFAVTGKMAAGKNHVSEILESEGFISVDADVLAHQAVELGKDKILQTFKDEAKDISFLNENGEINRRELAKIVFVSSENLAKQEAIVHPIVDKLINDFIDANPHSNLVINATVLYKTPVINRCNAIIYVDAPFFVRLFRAKKRDNLPIIQILKRFFAQKNLFSKYNFLNTDIYRVNNNVSFTKLHKRILTIIKEQKTK